MNDSIALQLHQEDLYKVFMSNDVKRWKEDIEIIAVELDFYKKLIQSKFDGKTAEMPANLSNGIEEMQSVNVSFSTSLQQFSNNLEAINECDNLQCETYFLNNHANFKTGIETHFSNYKQFKRTLFSYLKPQ